MAKAESGLIEANKAFYRAFESLDIREMEKIWLNESYIQCVHPGWKLLRGWDRVMTSWRRIFENTEGIRFRLTEVQILARDSLAWVTLHENITSRIAGGTTQGIVIATNIYEKREPGGWFIVHHQGSPVAAPVMEPEPTVH